MQLRNDPKVSKSYSLDPVVVAWLTQEAARRTIENLTVVSASEVANDILTKAMQEQNADEDVEKTRKMVKKNVLKQAIR